MVALASVLMPNPEVSIRRDTRHGSGTQRRGIYWGWLNPAGTPG